MTDDLLSIIGAATRLKRVASTNGGEYAGPCPFCGGKDRFRVWPNQDGGRWWCRQCERAGDAVAFLVETGRIDKGEAYSLRHGEPATIGTGSPTPPGPEPPMSTDPPSADWQARARELTTRAEDALWGRAGANALAWLRRRGLTDETIRRGRLGLVPEDIWESREPWGLDPDVNPETGKPRRVWIPKGVLIPWTIGGDLWRVNIRRPVRAGETPKCYSPPGFGIGLYNADALDRDLPAILLEGELDALTVGQVARDLIAPVATGGTGSARRARWIARLVLCPRVLVAFDADAAGESARRWWLATLPNGQYWRPYWGDANAMLQDGADVRRWVAAGLETMEPRPRRERFPLTLRLSPEQASRPGLALPNGCWDRQSDGSIIVRFDSAAILDTCVAATRAIRAATA